MKITDFQYDLSEEAIAQSAVEPRHSSRLLDTRDLSDHRFIDLPDLLEPGDLLIVNETRVRAARLIGEREDTGGRVELLLLEHRPDGAWEAMARPARRLRPGVRVGFGDFTAEITTKPEAGIVTVVLDAEDDEEAVDRVGSLPLPPYFTGTLTDQSRYQTLFANEPGSAAAPTAGLHFTAEVLDLLTRRGVALARVDLHVSIDTFRPMSVEHIEDHEMHSEWCAVPDETARRIAETKQSGGRVIAVGTTVVRTLESLADGQGGVEPGTRRTNLFLKPGVRFQVVDGLITNFHMPSSTLLVLLAAFMGPGWREAYETALERGYRFLSFGDSMICFRDLP
ncbi:MAG: tRNA preQ1(34) S-adenosylmethionine ribosyltransferase-isomerase QueA [Actinomycetota bacterium]|nr:tRNA preQ1(34) S-adenosylmethionine ribosyltransferase-isomerase QueA [Actinomycetota bacterium]